jgi:signal transduction histidine kinase
MDVGQRRVMPRLRNGRFPVRSKLVAVLLLPVVLLLALGISQVLRVRQDAREARAESRLAAAVSGPGSFLNLVVDERNHTAVYLLGAEELISSVGPGRYLETRQLVDEARQDFLDFIAGQDEQVQAVYEPAMAAVATLDDLRAGVDADTGPHDFQNVAAVQDLFTRFREVTDPLFDANRRVSLTVTEPDLQQGAALVDQSLRQSDTIALLTYSLVVAALAGDADGVNTGQEYVAVATLLRDLRAGEQLIRLNGAGEYAELVDALFASEHVRVFPELVQSALDNGVPDVGGLFANAGDEDAFGYDKLREEAEARIDVIAGDINRDARRTQTTFTVVGALVLLALAIVTTLVARSITRPLRSLTEQAMSMADERLPSAVQDILDTPSTVAIDIPRLEPIDIRTRDEVADVAQALTTVQDSALRLAVEQAALRRNTADSFVHLGRRNQTLLGRQLDFITELEQGETDPTALSNLFRLDHLATRMRRNAESLLVLAGVRPPRVWRVPMQIADIVRAALGEVENYHRVEIAGVEPAAIVGSAAADLAHLLAELIENALTFSPPHQRVEVSGRFRQIGPYGYDRRAPVDQYDDGAFTITISDLGIGMTAEDVARANERLAGNESFAVAPSQYLGHYVAGMIAQRHDITVRMDSDGLRGTRATVTLPSSLLSDEGSPSSPVPVGHWTFAPPPADRAVPPPPPPPPPSVAVAPARGRAVHSGSWASQPAPAASTPGHHTLNVAGVIDTIVEAQRARYVRDTLSRLSDGLAKGRGALARDEDAGAASRRTGAEASPGGHGQAPERDPDGHG